MKKTAFIILIALFIIACEDKVEQVMVDTPASLASCNYPLMDDAGKCCMDKDNNSICDKTEGRVPVAGGSEKGTLSSGSTSEKVQTPVSTATGSSSSGSSGTSSSASSGTEIKDALSGVIPTAALPGFMDVFSEEETTILFDASRTKGSMVMSALQMKLYLNNPGDLDVNENAREGALSKSALAKITSTNMILLGNGCNNDFIAAIEGLSGTGCEGTTKGTGYLKAYSLDGKKVLVILGFDDEDTYKIQKKVNEEEVSVLGQMVEVTI